MTTSSVCKAGVAATGWDLLDQVRCHDGDKAFQDDQAASLHWKPARLFLNQEEKPITFRTWRRQAWYPAEIRARKPYTMRHTFISVGLTNGVNIKWLANYCGTSVAMIEKHYGKYIRNDSQEQLSRLFGTKSATLAVQGRKK
jgi:integrase